MFFSVCLFLVAVSSYGQPQQIASPVMKQNLVRVDRSTRATRPAPSLAADNMVKVDKSKPATKMPAATNNVPARQQPLKTGTTETK